MDKRKLIHKFDKQAKFYHLRRLKKTEQKWRERLIPCAKGKVLEVGVGAGANFNFYAVDVEVTAVDFSKEMLNKAAQAAEESKRDVEFIHKDIDNLTFPDHSFDTIVSTLTFCGYENPVEVLRKLNRWCKVDGQILFMEHGISSNRWIGVVQTLLNPLFNRVVGCHLNRDILAIINLSDINVVQVEHHLFNAIHLIWAKPRS